MNSHTILSEITQPAEQLHTVSANGFTATVDAFARLESQEAIYFLSMTGTQTSVRAIAAAMLKGNPDPVFLSKGADIMGMSGNYFKCAVPHHTLGTWTIKTHRLPRTKATHILCYTKMAEANFEREGFVLIARYPEELPFLHHSFLDRRCPLPLHHNWANWLWRRAIENEEAIPLQSSGITGYYCYPHMDALRLDLEEAVRMKDPILNTEAITNAF